MRGSSQVVCLLLSRVHTCSASLSMLLGPTKSEWKSFHVHLKSCLKTSNPLPFLISILLRGRATTLLKREKKGGGIGSKFQAYYICSPPKHLPWPRRRFISLSLARSNCNNTWTSYLKLPLGEKTKFAGHNLATVSIYIDIDVVLICECLRHFKEKK